MKKQLTLLLTVISLLLLNPVAGTGQKITSKPISADLFGLFFEDINYAADGGLYAEMVQNRSFEYSPTDRRDWHPFTSWEYHTPVFSYGTLDIETSKPIHENNKHYAVLTIEHIGEKSTLKEHADLPQNQGVAGVGLKNTGFDYMVIKEGEKYNFSMFSHLIDSPEIDFNISLQNQKGEVLSEEKIQVKGIEWTRYSTTLTAKASCDSASLVVLATSPGKVALDMISLFPHKTFKGRTNGLRPDLAQLLADMQPAFIRFPGGCLVHGDGLGNMYRWKNTIGPVEKRKSQKNIWGYHQTNGLGYFEYFQFCEDIGAKPVPVLPAAVSCQNSGGTWRIGGTGQCALPLEEMDDYIQEVLDLIEWANGPADSKWGKLRAQAGHPEPFRLEYLGIGNEDKITPAFEERFKILHEAVSARYPEIRIIGTSGPFHSGEDYEKGWSLARETELNTVDEHYYVQPEWLISNQFRYDSYDRSHSKVYLGEYASWGNSLKNALAEAVYMTGLERNGDIVRMASYAPLFAKQNHTQWKTDMIFFDNQGYFLTPNYHIQRLFSVNAGDRYVSHVISTTSSDSTQAFSAVIDSKTGDIALKIVNAGSQKTDFEIDLSFLKKKSISAEKWIVKGLPEDKNTFEQPEQINVEESSETLTKSSTYVAPPYSFTVFKIKGTK